MNILAFILNYRLAKVPDKHNYRILKSELAYIKRNLVAYSVSEIAEAYEGLAPALKLLSIKSGYSNKSVIQLGNNLLKLLNNRYEKQQ